MKILIVANFNKKKFAPFIEEQVQAIKNKCVSVTYFGVEGKGIVGYLKNRKRLMNRIKLERPDIIHAHYGLSGLLSNLQRKVPVVTTYHGSDINYKKTLIFSKISIFLSKFNIFVSQKNIDIAKPKKNFALIPCGVDTEIFKPKSKMECRANLGFRGDEKLVLFSSSFDNAVKNAALAKSAVAMLNNVKLLELKGYNRLQVSSLMNAVDVCLLTSLNEGSPQFVKEASACCRPIVATDVGDIRQIFSGIEGCFFTEFNSKDCAEQLKKALEFSQKYEHTNGGYRLEILQLANKIIADKILDVYKNIVK
jgi:glycosyltransferase involved in cell wall biosynthesis